MKIFRLNDPSIKHISFLSYNDQISHFGELMGFFLNFLKPDDLFYEFLLEAAGIDVEFQVL